jgi:hypothetical protein
VRDAHADHLQFLAEIAAGHDPAVTPATAELARRAWEQIRAATGNRMPVPAACTVPDGQIFYCWDHHRHHLELEIIPNEPADYFYRDRQTNEYWGEECTIRTPRR